MVNLCGILSCVTVICSVSLFCVQCHCFVFSVTVLCSVSLLYAQCHCFVFSVTVVLIAILFCVYGLCCCMFGVNITAVYTL